MPKRTAEAPLQLDLAKRRCISSYTSISQSQSNASSTTWTSRDIIVLRAVGPGTTPSIAPVSFEASRSLLSRESSVFSNMVSDPRYSLAGNSEDPPCIDCDDDPKELGRLLGTIHDYRVYFKRPSWKKFESVAALLRLSTKYRINHLRNSMIRHMESTWYPLNPEDYLLLEENPSFPVNPAQHFAALALFVQTGAEKLLPAAYYRCATSLSFQRLFDLPIRPSPVPEDGLYFEDELTKKVCVQLSRILSDASTSFLGLIGKILLNEKHRDEAFRGATQCTEGFYRWMVDSSCRRASQNGGVDVLVYLRDSVESLKDNVCPSCWRDVMEEVEITQYDIWDDLPAV